MNYYSRIPEGTCDLCFQPARPVIQWDYYQYSPPRYTRVCRDCLRNALSFLEEGP